MPTLADIVEGLAAGVASADPADLQGLAHLHEAFGAAAGAAGGGGGGVAGPVADRAKRAGDLVEKVILGDAPDVQQAMDAVSKLVMEIQATLAGSGPADGGFGSTSAAAALPPADAGHEAPAAADPYAGAEPDFSDAGAAELGREFIIEATGHVEAAEAALLALEEHADDPEPVKALFRAFHTIKGTAGFVNLKQVPRLAHATESLLDLARQGQLEVAGPVADVVLDAIDKTKEMVAALQTALAAAGVPPTDPSLPALLARINAAAAGGATAVPASWVPATSVPAPESPATPEVASPAPAAQSLAPAFAPTPPAAANTGAAVEASVKVSTERLDRLINAVGELVIAQAMVEQSVIADSAVRSGDAGTTRNLAHLGKLTRELQDLAMSMRMVPIQGVFQKMARLARDLTRKSEKQIEFAAHGGETELDRNLVEAIADPLVHMIRNSADHGIEPPEVRVAASKPAAGRIELRAYHQGGSVVIEVRDDGKGLARSRILAKAIDRGLVRADQPMSEQEIFALIFHAGLSTAEKLTDVSGRGVGMDVVKRNIEQLRGRIEIDSTEGKGTTFTIRLPLTLAVIDGLVVKVGDERLIVPLLGVEQSLRLTPEQVSTVQGRGEMCLCRGSLLPIVRLSSLFGIPASSEAATDGLAVLIQDNVRRCCLLVDALIGRQQVVIKSLGKQVGQTRGVAGGAILGDGRVSLILDVPSLLDLAAGR